MAKEKYSSQTLQLFKSSIYLAFFFVLPVIAMFGINIAGIIWEWSAETQFIAGLVTVIIGFMLVGFYYTSNAFELLDKVAFSKEHWITPSNTIGCYPILSGSPDYFGVIDGFHIIRLKYEKDTFLGDELLISPVHPNDLTIQKSDWIPYKGLIYPARVAPLNTVELARVSLGKENGEERIVVVSVPIASSYHAKQAQIEVGKFTKNPDGNVVSKVIKGLDKFESLEFKEKSSHLQTQVDTYKFILDELKEKHSDVVADLEDLMEKVKKTKPRRLYERLFGNKWVRIAFVIGIITIIIGVLIVLRL